MGTTPSVEQSRKGGIASGVARRQQRAAFSERHAAIARIIDGFDREHLSTQLLASAGELAARALEADIEVHSPNDVRHLAEAANTLHKMARLELGEATANTLSLSMDREQVAQLLRERAAQLDTPPAPTQ